MRLSTAGMHRSSIEAILEQQVKLVEDAEADRHRQEIPDRGRGSDRRRARCGRWIARSRTTPQYARNSNIDRRAASTTRSRRWPMSPRCCRARATWPWQGANATLGPVERKMLANDVRQHLAALLDMANREDSQRRIPVRRHVARRTKPFAQGTTGVNYQGDQSPIAQIRIRSTQSLADGHAGADVFMDVAEAMACSSPASPATNTGTRHHRCGHASRIPRPGCADNYTLQFTSATDWQVVDDTLPTPVVIAIGHGIRPGQSISFHGVQRDHHRHAGRERYRSASRPRSSSTCSPCSTSWRPRSRADRRHRRQQGAVRHQTSARPSRISTRRSTAWSACAPRWARGCRPSTPAASTPRGRSAGSAIAAFRHARRGLRRRPSAS